MADLGGGLMAPMRLRCAPGRALSRGHMTTPNVTPRTCACASYWTLAPADSATWRIETTGCEGETQRTFTPGHDAKLKSRLIDWGASGYRVFRTDGDTDTGKDAAQWTAELGWIDAVESINKRRTA